jgi:hypothetical protein
MAIPAAGMFTPFPDRDSVVARVPSSILPSILNHGAAPLLEICPFISTLVANTPGTIPTPAAALGRTGFSRSHGGSTP